jgi:hypothetical protein
MSRRMVAMAPACVTTESRMFMASVDSLLNLPV